MAASAASATRPRPQRKTLDAMPDLRGPRRGRPSLAADRTQPVACEHQGQARPHIATTERARHGTKPERPSITTELEARRDKGKRRCASGTNHRREPKPTASVSATRAPNSASKTCARMARTCACTRGPPQRMASPARCPPHSALRARTPTTVEGLGHQPTQGGIVRWDDRELSGLNQAHRDTWRRSQSSRHRREMCADTVLQGMPTSDLRQLHKHCLCLIAGGGNHVWESSYAMSDG